MHRTEGGFSLVELLVAILVLGLLSTIAIASFRGPSKTGRAQALEAKIDGQANKLANWASQQDADAKFGASGGADIGNPLSTLTPAIAGQFAPGGNWTASYPPPEGQLHIGDCAITASPCAQISGCLDYFKSGRDLCLIYQYWPRGDVTGAYGGDAELRSRRITQCEPACTTNIYTALTNGLTSGTLSSPRTYNDNNPWAQVPSSGSN